MATIVVLRNKETGKNKSMYSVDARVALAQPNTPWEFVRRLGRTAKMIETGVAAEITKGAQDGAVEFHGDSVLQEDAKKAISPAPPSPDLSKTEPLMKTTETPQAPSGSRGGGKQEPTKKSEDK